jgi:hypothetical protein
MPLFPWSIHVALLPGNNGSCHKIDVKFLNNSWAGIFFPLNAKSAKAKDRHNSEKKE